MGIVGFEKLTKTQLIARLKRLQDIDVVEVYLVPCKQNPQQEGVTPYGIHLYKSSLVVEQEIGITRLEYLIEHYKQNFCNAQVGEYPSYYVPNYGTPVI